MANHSIPIVKITDSKLLEFFDELVEKHKFQPFQITIIGADGHITPDHPLVKILREKNAYGIAAVYIVKNSQCTIRYNKNVDPNRFARPDQIHFENSNNAITVNEALEIDELISRHFLNAIPTAAALQYDPDAFASVIASHQQIVSRIEQNLEIVNRKFVEERLKVQSEKDQFVRDKEAQFSSLEHQLRESYEEKSEALKKREKELDDRDNMHARRGIHADLRKRLKEHATKFALTDETRHMRRPIHIVVLSSLIVFITVIGYCWWLMASTPDIDHVLLVKSSLLTIAALGILTWYIRWMNRWFDQHAEAEFNLKQFELDIDRASWIVETSMEWRASQHGIIPTHLLESISRNLFSRREQNRDDEMHPADYLASALLGNASRARIKFGDAELDYEKKALKKAAKSVESEG